MILNSVDMTYIPKGWGSEQWIVNNGLYCGKKLLLRAGKQCSYHYHLVKDEVIFVQTGKVRFTYGYDDDPEVGYVVEVDAGQALSVSPGLRHKFFGIEDSVLIEFSTEHREEDTIRLQLGD